MTVNVSAEWSELIREKVASGAYGSADEVLDEALRVWRRHLADTDAEKEALRGETAALLEEMESGVVSGREYPAIRAAIQVGLDQLDRGEGIEIDAASLEEHFSETRIRERQRRKSVEA